ncbi:MAG: hypothetical protein HY761_01110 [Candidatus Omnitrophica bacterium]|nr:hypothetical protein [Candidatus Omnitrophota bacterium]
MLKTGFLLGAGFSKYGGMPLSCDFVIQAQNILDNRLERSYIPSREPKNLQSLVRFKDFVSDEKGREINHIEEIIKLSDQYRLTKDWDNIDKEVRDAIYEILIAAPFIMYLKDKNELYKMFDIYLRFLLIVADSEAMIATLNYDPLLELLLHTAAMSITPNSQLFHKFAEIVSFNYGIGDFSYRPLWGSSSNIDRVDILYFKLHGATNWEGCDQHGLTEVCDPLKTRAIGRCRECNMPAKPFIIYPVEEKKLNSQLSALWDTAFGALMQVEQIVIIGCRFNETDKDIFKNVNELISNNKRLVIVDPQGRQIKERIAKLNENVVYIDNGNGEGAVFEDIFCDGKTVANENFQEITNLRLRKDVQYFRNEQPSMPFFEEPVAT